MMPLRTDVRVTADIAPAMSPTSSDAAVPDVPPFALSGASPFLHAPDTFFVRIRVIHSNGYVHRWHRRQYYSDLYSLHARPTVLLLANVAHQTMVPANSLYL
jgi:hypothetical protein